MTVFQRPLPGRPLASLVLLASLAAPTGAMADITLVSRVSVTGGARGPSARTVTTHYRGPMVRTETGNVVSLYDTARQTITTINTTERTYRVLAMSTAFAGAPGVLSKIRFDTSASMAPTDETRTIAGKPARKYLGSATFKMSVQGMPATNTPETTMEIEQWSSDAISLPSAAGDVMSPVMRMVGPLQKMPGMEPLAKALASIRGVPLSNRITVTFSGAATPRPPVTALTEVVEVRETSLNPTLFRVPAGYRRLENAQLPSAMASARPGARKKPAHDH